MFMRWLPRRWLRDKPRYPQVRIAATTFSLDHAILSVHKHVMAAGKASPQKRPDWAIEKSHGGIVCGVDEVGRAPLAGPVVAVCACIPDDLRRKKIWSAVNDSKQLT